MERGQKGEGPADRAAALLSLRGRFAHAGRAGAAEALDGGSGSASVHGLPGSSSASASELDGAEEEAAAAAAVAHAASGPASEGFGVGEADAEPSSRS